MERLVKLLKLIIPYRWVVQSVYTLNRYSARLNMLNEAMSFAQGSNLEGDYLEFGVFEGRDFIGAYHQASICGLRKMNFYAFDSFMGLPDSVEYEDPTNPFKARDFACSLDQFKKNLRKAKVDFSRVQIIPGWYNQTLNPKTKENLPLTRAAIVWIDCDLYESTVPVLEFITGYLSNGSILIFDDWYLFAGNPGAGAQGAIREWLQKHPEIRLTEYHKFGNLGLSFIVHGV